MGSVLHRTTKYLTTGVSAMGLLQNGDAKFDPTVYVRNPDLSAVEGVESRYWIIEADDSIREADTTEKTTVDAARLPDIKVNLVMLTDTETGRRIELGFEHDDPISSNTYIFSLSDNGQRTYTAAFVDAAGRIAHQAAIPQGLPILWPDKDDVNVARFADETELKAFCTAAFDAVHDRKLAGALIKVQIMQAADEASAQAVYDAYKASPDPV